MADTQNTIYAQAYSRNIMQLAQQKYAKLINTVYLKPNVRGKTFFQDQIGEWSMAAKGGRNVQTPNNDPNLARRRGTMLDFHDNRLLDRGDELRTISDPRSAYTIAAASSLGRTIDDQILNGLVSSADSGETGSTSVTLSGTSIVTATTGSLWLSNIRSIKQVFDDNDIEESERFMVFTPAALNNMLGQEQLTSADYNSIKSLMRGEINTYMGFTWIWSTRIGQLTTSDTPYAGSISAIAFHKYGACAAMGAQPLVRTDERKDLSYSWQVYYELNVGTVRLEEKRVVLATAT